MVEESRYDHRPSEADILRPSVSLLPSQAQIHPRYCAVRFFGPEIFLWLEIEHRGNDVVWKYLDLRAIVRDQVVVELTSERDPVLR